MRRGDGVDHRQCRVAGRVHRGADLGMGSQPVEVSLCTTQTALMRWPVSLRSLASYRLGTSTPLRQSVVDEFGLQAHLLGHLLPQRGELAGSAISTAVAGGEGVDESGLPGAGAGGGVDDHRVGGLEDLLAGSAPCSANGRTRGRDGRCGVSIARRMRSGSGDGPRDLEEMTAGGVGGLGILGHRDAPARLFGARNGPVQAGARTANAQARQVPCHRSASALSREAPAGLDDPGVVPRARQNADFRTAWVNSRCRRSWFGPEFPWSHPQQVPESWHRPPPPCDHATSGVRPIGRRSCRSGRGRDAGDVPSETFVIPAPATRPKLGARSLRAPPRSTARTRPRPLHRRERQPGTPGRSRIGCDLASHHAVAERHGSAGRRRYGSTYAEQRQRDLAMAVRWVEPAPTLLGVACPAHACDVFEHLGEQVWAGWSSRDRDREARPASRPTTVSAITARTRWLGVEPRQDGVVAGHERSVSPRARRAATNSPAVSPPAPGRELDHEVRSWRARPGGDQAGDDAASPPAAMGSTDALIGSTWQAPAGRHVWVRDNGSRRHAAAVPMSAGEHGVTGVTPGVERPRGRSPVGRVPALPRERCSRCRRHPRFAAIR